jgi:hypothetical protein
MSTIVTRASKGSTLTFTEADANFDNLNNDKVEEVNPTTSGTLAHTGAATISTNLGVGGTVVGSVLTVGGNTAGTRAGLEVIPSASSNALQIYDRTGGAYGAMNLIASEFAAKVSGTTKFSIATTGNALFAVGTVPAADTAAVHTNTTQLATTAFVQASKALPITVQRLTSGTGATYTTPANCKWIEVEIQAGGGGGGGSGTTPGNGGTGGTSTFNSISAVGGGGGTGATAGTAGTASGGNVLNLSGYAGQAGSGATLSPGGNGGTSRFGGTGHGGQVGAGTGANGGANTGSGGGGGGVNATVNGGGGGGSGGYILHTITSPAATYTYTVGAGGTSGTLGTNGAAGGVGGTGVIIVREYY